MVNKLFGVLDVVRGLSHQGLDDVDQFLGDTLFSAPSTT